MSPLFAFFVLFSPVWWILLFASSAIIITSLQYEKTWQAAITVLVTVVLMTLFGSMPTLDTVKDNGLWLLGGAVLYVVAGTFWSFFKWNSFCDIRLEKYEDEKRDWLYGNGVTEGKDIPDALKAKWNKNLLNSQKWSYYTADGSRVIQIRPLFWQNKALCANWMFFAPWDFVWWLFDGMFRSIFRAIQRWTAGLYEAISIRKFRGVENDWAVPPAPPVEEVYSKE